MSGALRLKSGRLDPDGDPGMRRFELRPTITSVNTYT